MTDEKVYSVDEVNHLISEMDKVIAKLKTENAALRERLEKYKISFKKVYMDFFSKLNRDKDFRKRFDNVTLGCQLTMFEDALDKAEARLVDAIKTENVALRERLEKAVELPCKLYDKVWDKNRSEFEILEIRVTGTNFYIYCGNKTTGETVYFDGEDIGDEWFTTEEACDLHRRAFGLDKPKNESDEVRLAELKQDYIVFSNLRDTRNTRQDL